MTHPTVPAQNVLDRFRLDGRVAVVTGGGTGIGRAIALGLADAGADVVVAGRRPAPLHNVVDEITARGRRGLAVSVDVTVESDIERLAEAAAEVGPLWAWVNDAGGLQGEPMDRWRASALSRGTRPSTATSPRCSSPPASPCR